MSGSPKFLLAGGQGLSGPSSKQRRTEFGEPVERVGELIGPGPPVVDFDLGSALPAGEAGGDVQQPVAQRLGFGLGQLTAQQDGLGPSDQVGGGEGQLQPGLVDLKLSRREAADPGLLDSCGLVLDAGVCPMPGVQPGQLPGRGVGGQRLVTPAVVGFEHADLSTRVGTFPFGTPIRAGICASASSSTRAQGGRYLHVRRPGQVTSIALVVATGVTATGGREVLGVDVGDSEDEVC